MVSQGRDGLSSTVNLLVAPHPCGGIVCTCMHAGVPATHFCSIPARYWTWPALCADAVECEWVLLVGLPCSCFCTACPESVLP